MERHTAVARRMDGPAPVDLGASRNGIVSHQSAFSPFHQILLTELMGSMHCLMAHDTV